MGESATGNTTMLLDEGLDTGPILLQQALAIGPEQTAPELFDELARGGAPLVVDTLARLDAGTLEPRPQNPAGATLAPLLKREDGLMNFAARTAVELKNRWRGFQPWPGAFTFWNGKKLIVHRMEVTAGADALSEISETGRVIVQDDSMIAACAQGTWLELAEVQLEGKKRVTAAEFLHGLQPGARAGLRFG
jgi:methionyl-tRNA formyltransferase